MCNITEFDNSISLEEMRDARGNANVAFINFTDCHDKFDSHIFCFYEGEDGKYYNQKIKSTLGENIVTIKAGKKIEVLKVWRKIKSDNHYDDIKKCFFVDRDMDEDPADKNEDLYITPCYSIENLYVTKKAFGNILQSEFSCDIYESDYHKCMTKFEELLGLFNEQMLEFNALVLIRRNKGLNNGKVQIRNIKTMSMFETTINGISKKQKYEECITKLKNDLSVSDIEVSNSVEELKSRGDYNNLFRGKNQLDFLVKLLDILKELHNNEQFFEKKRTSVTLNLTNNRLSELSQYADFPPCLVCFLKNHAIS